MKFELGHKSEFIIRKVNMAHSELSGVCVAFLSDLHCNAYSAEKIHRIIQALDDLNPEVILLGGDYVDSRKGWASFKTLLQYLSNRPNVISVLGNHDRLFMKGKIKAVFSEYDLPLLDGAEVVLRLKSGRVAITNSIKPVEEPHDFCVHLFHKPNRLSGGQENALVLAGHLHGSQVVFNKTGNVLYPGRLFYFWNRLEYMEFNNLYVISRGLGTPCRFG